MFTVAGVRYYASGFTSGGSYEALEALARGGLAAGALAVYPEVFGTLSVLTNHLTYGITHAPGVEPGLTKLLAAATVANFTPLGIGTIAAVVAVVLLVLLLITKIVIATLLALLYVAAPVAIALWPLPETSWLARTWLQSLLGGAAVAGGVVAVLRAVRGDERVGVHAAAARSATSWSSRG